MRVYRTVLPLLLGLTLAACDAVFGPEEDFPRIPAESDEHLSEPQRSAYQEDAVRLAIRHLEAAGSPAVAEVNPPADLVSSLYGALVRVSEANHPAFESVANVHTFPMPATREILVNVNSAASWTAAWRDGETLTGEPDVDALIEAHDLTMDRFYRWTIGDYAVLRAAAPLNARALSDRFERIPGVIHSEQNGAVGDGNDIRASAQGDGWRLDYSLGYGDCPSGCIGRDTRSFLVTAAGEVEYLGRSGSPLPTDGTQ